MMKFAQRAGLALVVALLAACGGKPEPAQFVGKWKSTRLATPLHLHGNGDWEIRDAEGAVLQYGVWQVRDRTFVWSIKLDGALQHDPNPIMSVQPGRFELRERDGSVTRFDRIGEP
jgi:hypothetical protein